LSATHCGVQTTCAGSEEKRGDQNAIKVDKPYMLVTSDFDAKCAPSHRLGLEAR
jgi:hypothetical protein